MSSLLSNPRIVLLTSMRAGGAILAIASTLHLSGCCDVLGGCAEGGPLPVRSFEVLLTGDNVVPPVRTNASGAARFNLSGNEAYVQYAVAVANLTDSAAARLHVGTVGSNGPASRLLCGPCTVNGGNVTAGGSVPVDAALVTSMRGFGAYLEISTAAGPVLRGQLRVVGQ